MACFFFVRPNSPSVSQDNLLSSLKSEVERSLACLQSKNEQLRKLHSDWQGACAKLKLLQQELDSFKVEKVKAEVCDIYDILEYVLNFFLTLIL